jgi:hypothetical protein
VKDRFGDALFWIAFTLLVLTMLEHRAPVIVRVCDQGLEDR